MINRTKPQEQEASNMNNTEWPELSQAPSVEKMKPATTTTTTSNNRRPITTTANLTKKQQQKQKQFIDLGSSKKPVKNEAEIGNPTNASKASPWAALKSQTSDLFSLQDVINEEMKKSSVTKKVSEQAKSSGTAASLLESPKTTTITTTTTTTTRPTWKTLSSVVDASPASTSFSFSKIVEMEETSQSRQMKNRPLNSIQLEERAIEELRKLYNIDALTDELITIELVDDDQHDPTTMTLFWKKK